MSSMNSSDPDFYPAPEDYAELHSAYRSAVSAALMLQRILNLPPERRSVLDSSERKRLAEIRQARPVDWS